MKKPSVCCLDITPVRVQVLAIERLTKPLSNMRVVIFILSLLSTVYSFEAPAQTNDHCLVYTYQARHGDFEWHMYFSRMLATPEWNMDSEKIPLQPDKAWQIARSWFRTNNCANPELVSIEIRPVVREQEATGDIDQRLAKRFYYRIQCIPGFLDTMVVYVLMDGSVLEPIREPPNNFWW